MLRGSVEDATHQSEHLINICNGYLRVIVFDEDKAMVSDCLDQVFRCLWPRLAYIQDRQLD